MTQFSRQYLSLSLLLVHAPLLYSGNALAGGPFLQSLELADGRQVVVAEPRLEPRSIGSFSIRVYSGANPRYPYDDFLTGIVVPRDGYIERALLAQLDEAPGEELVVLLRSAGSGDYGRAVAFAVAGDHIEPLTVRSINPAGQRFLQQLEQ